jgi:hypothetical protein
VAEAQIPSGRGTSKISNRLKRMIETELDVLHDVSCRLESAGISFMLTGSVAMNYYEYLRSCAKTLEVDALLDEILGYE